MINCLQIFIAGVPTIYVERKADIALSDVKGQSIAVASRFADVITLDLTPVTV